MTTANSQKGNKDIYYFLSVIISLYMELLPTNTQNESGCRLSTGASRKDHSWATHLDLSLVRPVSDCYLQNCKIIRVLL